MSKWNWRAGNRATNSRTWESLQVYKVCLLSVSSFPHRVHAKLYLSHKNVLRSKNVLQKAFSNILFCRIHLLIQTESC